MNSINLIGNLTKPNESRKLQNGTEVFQNNIAVRKNFKNKTTNEYDTDFINVSAFGKTAEILNKYTDKGHKVLLNGRLEPQTYEKDGIKHYSYTVVVESFEFLQGKVTTNNEQKEVQPTQDTYAPLNDDIVLSDEDLPF